MSSKHNFAKGPYRQLRSGSLKEAVAALVTAVGGQGKAAEVLGVFQSQVSRWCDPSEPTTLDVGRVLTLERVAGDPIVTRYLADQHGASLDWGDAASVGFAEATGQLMSDAATVNASVLQRLDDGVIDADEARELLAQLHGPESAIATMRRQLSDIAAKGECDD